jgi:hypothetical protein
VSAKGEYNSSFYVSVCEYAMSMEVGAQRGDKYINLRKKKRQNFVIYFFLPLFFFAMSAGNVERHDDDKNKRKCESIVHKSMMHST